MSGPVSLHPCQARPFEGHTLLRCCSSAARGHLASLSAGHSEVHGPLSQAVRPPQGRPERHVVNFLELCDAQGCTELPHTLFSSPLLIPPLAPAPGTSTLTHLPPANLGSLWGNPGPDTGTLDSAQISCGLSLLSPLQKPSQSHAQPHLPSQP